MHHFKAKPLRRQDIRDLANRVRGKLGMSLDLWFPVVEFAELGIPPTDPNYLFLIAERHELGSSHGLTEREGNQAIIKIRDDIYERACDGEGRDRGTVAHEVGHYLMHARSTGLHRHFGGELRSFEDPEWQAKCFQGELLVPRHRVAGMAPWEVAQKCGVSIDAADYQLKLYGSGK